MCIFSSFSYPSGEPPTPTKTPTSPNFFLNSFQTPKQDFTFHGPQSPWSPTFPSSTSPDFRTPTRLSFATPKKSPSKNSGFDGPSIGNGSDAEISSHVQQLSPNPSLPLPPVDPSRQLPSSPNTSLTSEAKPYPVGRLGSYTPVDANPNVDAAQMMHSARSMQTPPPTSSSASRRKAQEAQVATRAEESVVKGRKSMPTSSRTNIDSMEVLTSQVEESPLHFQNLQFSPEVFAFPTSGPATAPVYPQHKLFWDSNQDSGTMDIDFSMDDTFNTFDIGLQKPMDPFASPQRPTTTFSSSPGFSLLGTRGGDVADFTATSQGKPASSKLVSTELEQKPLHRKLTGNGVNPSLLFSSPKQVSEKKKSPIARRAPHDEALQPYAHQVRDAAIEREMQKSRKPKRKRGLESDSPAVKAALETLRDDRGDLVCVGRNFIDHVDTTHGRPDSRTSSNSSQDNVYPAQRSKHDRQQHKRTAVTLTIDASGRAKTETKVISNLGESSRNGTDVDRDEDSESDSSSSSAEMVISRPQSFAYSTQGKQKPKLRRFVAEPKSHSQQSSYASNLAVNRNPDLDRRRSSSSLFMEQKPGNHPYATKSRLREEDAESEAETLIHSDDDTGDAQSELKKVLDTRTQRKSSKRSVWSGSKSRISEQRLSYHPQNVASHPYYKIETVSAGQQGYQAPYSNISPTTITDPDLTTPSTGRSSNISSDNTRCVCHTSDYDGQLMIQWSVVHRRIRAKMTLTRQSESCSFWQHVGCVGLDPQKLPNVHLCIFCTGSTPNVRGGRVREPVRAAFPPLSSPLARKSHRYR